MFKRAACTRALRTRSCGLTMRGIPFKIVIVAWRRARRAWWCAVVRARIPPPSPALLFDGYVPKTKSVCEATLGDKEGPARTLRARPFINLKEQKVLQFLSFTSSKRG